VGRRGSHLYISQWLDHFRGTTSSKWRPPVDTARVTDASTFGTYSATSQRTHSRTLRRPWSPFVVPRLGDSSSLRASAAPSARSGAPPFYTGPLNRSAPRSPFLGRGPATRSSLTLMFNWRGLAWSRRRAGFLCSFFALFVAAGSRQRQCHFLCAFLRWLAVHKGHQNSDFSKEGGAVRLCVRL